MKILIVEGEASNKSGGAELSMFSYIKHLNTVGHEVFLVYDKAGDWLSDEENQKLFKASEKIQIDSFTAVGMKSFIKNLKAYINFAKTHNIDLIFTHTIHGFFFLRLANLFLNLNMAVYFKWVFTKPSTGFLNKWGIRGFGKVAFLPAVKDYWLNNGINPKARQATFNDGLEIIPNQTFNVNPVNDIKNLAYFGRITKSKGVHLIIEALANFKDLRLDIYGRLDDGNYTKELESLIIKLRLDTRIKLLGFTPDPTGKLINYDLVVVPSIGYEAQGRVLFEAMFTKTLIIATDNGGMPEILGDFSDQLIFDANAVSLSNKLQEIQSLKQEEIVEIKNYLNQRFTNYYSEETTHRKLDQLLFA